MTILFADGFEDTADADYPGTNTSISAGNGRRGGKALSIISNGSETFGLPAAATTMFAHVALNPGVSSGVFISFYEGTRMHIGVGRGSDGSITAYRGIPPTTLLGTSAAGLVPASGYTSFQIKVVIHDTTGSVEVRLNGSSTPALNLTNVDTKDAGTTGAISAIQFGGGSNFLTGSGAYWDDFVVWDTAGSVNNTWLGDLRVDSYLPTADGDTTTMTTSTGSTHYTLVDEVPASGTDYVMSKTVGQKDLFQMADMSHSPLTIHAVIPVGHLLKDDAGSRDMALMVKSGATESDGPNYSPSTSALKFTRIIETNPDGSVAWTKSAFDALQVGVKITT